MLISFKVNTAYAMSLKISILWFVTSADDSATNSLLLNIPTNPFAEIGFLLGLIAKKSSVVLGIREEESSLFAYPYIKSSINLVFVIKKEPNCFLF